MNETVSSQKITAVADAETGKRRRPFTAVVAKKSLGMPFWLVVAYFLVDYVRPQDTFPVLDPLRIAMVLSIVLGLTWLAKGDKNILRDPVIIFYGLFILLVASTVVFAVNTFWTYHTTRSLAIYFFAVTLPSVAFLGTRERMLKFFNIWIAIHVYLALTSIARGGTGSGSFLGDNNDWALALNIAVPYAFFLSRSPHCGKLMRGLYLAALSVLIIAIAVTESRGGFVGLVAVIVGLLFFSRHRIRNLLLLGVMAAILVPTMPTTYFDRVQTIASYSDESSRDRLYSWRLGWQMFLDNPVLGVGAGNYPWTVHIYEEKNSEFNLQDMRAHGGRAAHSLYFTLLPELGSVGVLIYSAILILVFRKLARLGRLGKSRRPPGEALSDLDLLARAMLVSLIGYLVSGTFLSVLYYPHVWYLIGFVLALERAAAGPAGSMSALDVNHRIGPPSFGQSDPIAK